MKHASPIPATLEWLYLFTYKRQCMLLDSAIQAVEEATADYDEWSRRYNEGVNLYHYNGNIRATISRCDVDYMSCTELTRARKDSKKRLKDAHAHYESVGGKLQKVGWTFE